MLSLAKMSAGSEEYFLKLIRYYLNSRRRRKRRSGGPDDQPDSGGETDGDGIDVGAADPYSIEIPGEPPGWWFGQGAAALGLTGQLEEAPFRQIFKGFHPSTGEPLVQNAGEADHTPGWDACFTAIKEYSILWSQAAPEERANLEKINRQAAEETLRMFEQRFAFSRAGKAEDGCEFIPVGMVAAIFEHASSRAKDPNLHLHCLVLNVGVDEKGHTRALDSRFLFQNKMLLGAYYRAKLAAALRRCYALRVKVNGRSYTIEGCPRELVKTHSKRRQQILAELARQGESGAIAAAAATLKTRPGKDPLVSRQQLFQQWQEVNQAAGFGDQQVARLLRHRRRKPVGTIKRAIAWALEQITFERNHFTRKDLLLQTLWALPAFGLEPDNIIDEVDALLKNARKIIPLGSIEGELRYTTAKVLHEEQRLLKALDRLNSRAGRVVSPQQIEKQLKKRQKMAPEQADFVRHLAETPTALRAGQGFAGTGKTFALRAFVDSCRSQGYRVIAATPTGKARDVLSREIGIPCKTITKLLGDFRLPLSAQLSHHVTQLGRAARGKRTWRFRQPRPQKLPRKAILLVDESGMVSTRHTRMLAELCLKHNATLCLVGDPAQLPPVESTSPFQAIGRRYGSATMKEIHRQNDEWARQASRMFAEGQVADALKMYADRKLVTVRDTIDEVIRQACLDWTVEGLLTPQRAVILANTNEAVEVANHLCQQHRLAAKTITPRSSVRITDEQDNNVYQSQVYVGDRVVFTRNSLGKYGYGVENGTLGTIVKIGRLRPTIDVALDDGRCVVVDTRTFPHIRLAYALTTYRSQGSSLAKVYSIVDGGDLQNLPTSYVQATRAVEEARFYTTADLLNPDLTNIESSPLVEKMSRKPDLRLASEFLDPLRVEQYVRKPRLRDNTFSQPSPKKTSQRPTAKPSKGRAKTQEAVDATPPQQEKITQAIDSDAQAKPTPRTKSTAPPPASKQPKPAAHTNRPRSSKRASQSALPMTRQPPASQDKSESLQPPPVVPINPAPLTSPALPTVLAAVTTPVRTTTASSPHVPAAQSPSPSVTVPPISIPVPAALPPPTAIIDPHSFATVPASTSVSAQAALATTSLSPSAPGDQSDSTTAAIPSPSARHSAPRAAEQPPATAPIRSAPMPAVTIPIGAAAISPSASPSAVVGHQRLRLHASSHTIRNGSLLQASCVDGGTHRERNRPAPPPGHPLSYFADTLRLQRVLPVPLPPITLQKAVETGLLSLVGTGGPDYVQVLCKPHETWILDVPNHFSLISTQNDMAEAKALYEKPSILKQFACLDRIEDRLQRSSFDKCLLLSLFALCRREASWLLPTAKDPAAITREHVHRFCQLFFFDSHVQEMLDLVRFLGKSIILQATALTIQEACRSLPHKPTDRTIVALTQDVVDGTPFDNSIQQCLHSILQQYQRKPTPQEVRIAASTLVEATTAAGTSYVRQFTPEKQRAILDTLFGATGLPPAGTPQFHPALTWPLRCTHQRLEEFVPLGILWNYAMSRFQDNRAKAEESYEYFQKTKRLVEEEVRKQAADRDEATRKQNAGKSPSLTRQLSEQIRRVSRRLCSFAGATINRKNRS